MVAGVVTMVSPDVNTIFLPVVVEGVQESHFARSYAGFVAAVGYLAMRFYIFLIKSSSWYSGLIYHLCNDDFKNV